MTPNWIVTMVARLVALAVLGGATWLHAASPGGPLATVRPGEWELREAGGATRRLCVAQPMRLLSVAHPGAACTRSLIAADAGALTVSYLCRGLAQGRSTLTVHSPRRLHLHTQGIAAGAPFNRAFAGRRTGDCAPPATPRS